MKAFLCATNNDGDVYKTHDIEAAKLLAREGIPLFVTHRESTKNAWDGSACADDGAAARNLEKEWGIPKNSIKVLQRTASVAQREWKVVRDYEAYFAAPPLRRDGHDVDRYRQAVRAMGAVVEYIRPWSTLRRCCGSQMSRNYRRRLYRAATAPAVMRRKLLVRGRFPTTGRPHESAGHLSYDACEMYDIDAVETMLVRTKLFQQCPGTLRAFQDGDVLNLSEDAGPIDGGYCRRYRDAAVATRAALNDNPWKLMRQQGPWPDLKPARPAKAPGLSELKARIGQRALEPRSPDDSAGRGSNK